MPQALPQILLTSAGRSWNRLEADFVHVPRGKALVPGDGLHRLGMHFGPPVNATCSCDGLRVHGMQGPGGIDIVPARFDGEWEDDADCRILRLGLHPSLIEQVADDLGKQAGEMELRPRLQIRDSGMEAIGWAVKAALESGAASDSLYIDLLAQALTVRLIETACGHSLQTESRSQPKFSTRQLRHLTDFIESNLDQKLQLADLAKVAAVSVTRLKTLFRNSTGESVHQYVIRRRVEHARALLISTTMPLSEVALAAGFSHQSHLSHTMRRLLGQTPGEIVRQSGDFRPIL